MFKRLSLATGLAVALSAPVLTQNLAADLQRAKQREMTSGDCKSLLPEYARIADQGVKSDRAAVAEALIRMGRCHEQLGDGMEKKFYARVTTVLADVREMAAEARRRLNERSAPAADKPQTPSRHLAWTVDRGLWVYGRISANGRYLPFSTKLQGHDQLLLRDMVTGRDRQLTSTPPGGVGAFPWDGAAGISPDGGRVAFSWNKGNQLQEVRVLGLQEAGIPEAVTIFTGERGEKLYPHEWTPDRNFIAMEILRYPTAVPVDAGSYRVGLLSLKDGSFRVLRTLPQDARPFASSIFVSPNGKYLAFDVLTAGKPGRDIVIIDAATNADVGTIAHAADDTVVGWTADGTDVLFASDRRSGAWALWSSAFRPGSPLGVSRLIAQDFNPFNMALGVTASGEIWSLRNGRSSTEVRVSSLDFSTGAALSAPTDVAQEYLGTNVNPSWSPDGNSLAYVSVRGTAYVPRIVVVVRSLTTNRIDEVRPDLTKLDPEPHAPMLWWPDGQSILLAGSGASGQGFYRVDLKTGDTTLVTAGGLVGPAKDKLRLPFENRSISADGGKLFYQRGPLSSSIVERNLATGAERVVCTLQHETMIAPQADLSRDGRFAYCMRPQRDSDPQGPRMIIEIDLTSGATREIPAPHDSSKIWVSPDGEWIAAADHSAVHFLPARGSTPAVPIASESGRFVAWSPDSKAVVLARGPIDPNATENWWIPIDGRVRRKLEAIAGGALGIGPSRIHPDGRRIAQMHSIGRGLDEVWVLRGVAR